MRLRRHRLLRRLSCPLAAGAVLTAALAVLITPPARPGGTGPAPSVGAAITLPFGSTSTTSAPSSATTVAPTTTTAPPVTTTTSPTPPTTVASTPTTTAGSGGFAAALYPCGATSPSVPCADPPAGVAISYPDGSQPAGMKLTWAPSPGRPAGAPKPATTSTVLDASAAVTCPSSMSAPAGGGVMCWPWPSALDDAGTVLNGTYQAAPCAPSGSAGSCSPFPGTNPFDLALAAPPAAPRSVAAAVAASAVTVTWKASASPEPDLIGYLVTRDGQETFACSAASYYTGSDPPCPAPLTATDHPGGGVWRYQVEAVRLGEGSGTYALVASSGVAATPSLVTVQGPRVGEVAAGGATVPALALARAFPGVDTRPSAVPAGSANSDDPSFADEPGAGAGGQVSNLAYPTGRAPGTAAMVTLSSARGGRAGVLAAGLAGIAMLAAALSAILWYLRARLALVEVRRSRDDLR